MKIETVNKLGTAFGAVNLLIALIAFFNAKGDLAIIWCSLMTSGVAVVWLWKYMDFKNPINLSNFNKKTELETDKK